MLVQPSTRRAYTMDEYENAGAIIQEDLSPASLIMAVKQVRLTMQFWELNESFFFHLFKEHFVKFLKIFKVNI